MRARLALSDPVRADLLLAVVLAVVGQVGVWGGYSHQGPKPLAASTALLIAGMIALRRRTPIALGVVFLFVSLVQAIAARPLNSLWALLVLVLSGYSVAAYARRNEALLAGALILLGTYVSQLADPAAAVSDKVLAPLVLVGAPWIAGQLVRRHRQQASQLERLNLELSQRRAQELEQAAQQERARIARELHDVIVHSISVMVVQAGAAEQVAADGAALDALRSIRQTGKSALAEMRRLLAVLRTDLDHEALRPQPGITELPEMVQRIRDAGIEVELKLDPALPRLQPGPDLVVYRVVQEALTNSLKHAGGTAANVRLLFDGHGIEVEAIDSGGEGKDGRADGVGHGLVGMRERLALYGGTLASGPTPTGGWRVHARLPVDPESLR